MRSSRRTRFPLALLMASALAALPGRLSAEDSSVGADESGQAAPTSSGPVPILLGAPKDLDDLWNRLASPDYLLIPGDLYRRLARDGGQSRVAETAAPVVGSVIVRGHAGDGEALLTIEFGGIVAGGGPAWVGLGLAGLTVTSVREGDAETMARRDPSGSWLAKLSGPGARTLVVEARAPLRTTPEGTTLELPIPEAPSTRVDLLVPGRPVTAAACGDESPVSITESRRPPGSRLASWLAPTGKVALTWSQEVPGASPETTLLSARGDLAVQVDASSLRTRAAWEVSVLRGSTDRLAFRLDPAEELLEVELDRQPVPIDRVVRTEGSRVEVPLAGPLRAGRSLRLGMTTRRPISGGGRPIELTGFPLEGATSQTGLIAVAHGSDLWVGGSSGPNLRRIDPRTELSDELRGRPDTVLAYQFLAQPFALTLTPEVPRQRLSVDARTTIRIGAGSALVSTWLDYRASRGRLFDLMIEIPPGLDRVEVGPPEVVLAQTIRDRPGGSGVRDLAVRVVPRSRDNGGFRLELRAEQPLPPGARPEVGMFRPLDATVIDGWVRVDVGDDVTATLDPEAGRGSGFEEVSGTTPRLEMPPLVPARPVANAALAPTPLWLRHAGRSSALPLVISRRPQVVESSSVISARVGTDAVEFEQETTLRSDLGPLGAVEFLVPHGVDATWRVEGGSGAGRGRASRTRAAEPRVRILLPGDGLGPQKLLFRYTLAIRPALRVGASATIPLPWFRPVGTERERTRAVVSARPGVVLRIAEGDETWPTASPTGGPGAGRDAQVERLELAEGNPDADTRGSIVATALALADLPAVVAPRLWIHTEQTQDFRLQTTARFLIETRDPTLTLALPTDARFVRASVGGRTVAQVERLATPSSYRLRVPGDVPPGGSFLLEVVYLVEERAAGRRWLPPSLPGAAIQKVIWQVSLPWNRALLGVPTGWVDENEWYWDAYVWKRRPSLDEAALGAWVVGSRARTASARDSASPNGVHSYLFSRSGELADLPATIAPRIVLVSASSGSVLALGIVLLVWRRWAGMTALLGLGTLLALGLVIEPDTALQIAQSSLIGGFLLLVAYGTHGLVERRRQPRAVEASDLGIITAGSSQGRVPSVGSDDSTAIRARPGSTAPQVHVPPNPPGDEPYIELRPPGA